VLVYDAIYIDVPGVARSGYGTFQGLEHLVCELGFLDEANDTPLFARIP